MGRTALAGRIGTVLHLVESGGEAEIVRSYKVTGDFPAHSGIEVTFDYAKRNDDKIVVQVSRGSGGKVRVRKEWVLAAIEDRDSKGLEGFIEFATSLGIKGAQFAKLIESMKPVP